MKRGVILRNVEKISPEIHRWGKLWNLATQEDGKEGSGALLDMRDPNDPQWTKEATRYYFILRGRGKIIIESETYLVEQGTFLRIPPQTKHNIIPIPRTPGERLKLIVFSVPAYSEDDTYYDKSFL